MEPLNGLIVGELITDDSRVHGENREFGAARRRRSMILPAIRQARAAAGISAESTDIKDSTDIHQ